jgi:cobalt/nickel transport system permease protein
MGAGHSHALYVHEHSIVHRMAPEAKLVAAIGMVVSIAVTPREAIWAFALYAFSIISIAVLSRVRLRFIAVRLLAIAPFVLFALFIPFIATGETVEIAFFEVSVDGLWGAWNILIKAVLGASVSIVLTATTEVAAIIRGLGVLHVPVLFTSIATFMIRYLELIADELGRMRVAMTSRGYDPRWINQVRPIASSAGALFIRTYERGERVHASMVARGFNGEMPVFERPVVAPWQWLAVLIVVLAVATTATTAIVLT